MPEGCSYAFSRGCRTSKSVYNFQNLVYNFKGMHSEGCGSKPTIL